MSQGNVETTKLPSRYTDKKCSPAQPAHVSAPALPPSSVGTHAHVHSGPERGKDLAAPVDGFSRIAPGPPPGTGQGQCCPEWGQEFSQLARDPLEKENTFPVDHASAPLGHELWPLRAASLGFWNVRGAGGHAATHSWPHTAGQSEAALRKAQGCRDVNGRRLALSLLHVGKHMV